MTESIKTIRILFQPVFTDGKATSIKGCTILSIPSITAGKCIVGIYTKFGPTPCQNYDDLVAKDASGSLKLSWKDIGEKKNIRQWYADRDTVGDIAVHWEAFPRTVTSETIAGPRIDTRADGGGIESCLVSIVPVPWGESEIPTETYRKILEWNLNGSPPGTRAVSSYGEGPQPIEKTGELKSILSTIIMVGPIKSYPPAGDSSYFGYYWFGDNTPETITRLGPFLARAFQKMSDFFQDPASKTNGYRIFVRCASPAQAHGGGAVERSFLLEYNYALPTIAPDDVLYLLSHEMVHNWPVLDSTPFGTSPDNLVAWFNEGIADYYGSILPYRFGLASKESFLTQVNRTLTAYYTNPLRNITDKESMEVNFGISDAQDLPYKRGFTYFCWLDREIRHAAPGKSLDDLIIDICQRKKKEEPHTLPVFLDMIKQVTPHMIQVFHDMQAGKLIVPPADCLSPEFELVEEAQEIFTLGFSESSVKERKISGLAAKHRARDAGVMDGDQILTNTFLWQCRGHLEQKMVLNLRRDGKELEISYWPRSYEKVESWQFREKLMA